MRRCYYPGMLAYENYISRKYMNTRTKTYWALIILPVLVFFAGAYMKLTGSQIEVEGFQNFGYSLSFMYFIGACELLGALGLLLGQFVHAQLPRLAALGLLIIMLGALYTHVTHPPVLAGIPALIVTILLVTFLQVSRPKQVLSA